MSVITGGYKLTWGNAGPPPATFQPNHSSADVHAAFVTDAIQALVAKGAVAVAQSAPIIISPLSVISRRGKLRLVLDLTLVNEFCAAPPKFKYETISTATDVFRPNDWTFSIDLEAAYHHVDMHPSAWPYLGFQWQGVSYVFCVLPFGLASACWIFTKITRELVGRWRALGIRCHHYLDDLGFGVEPDADGGTRRCRTVQQRVLDDLRRSGFIVNLAKLKLTPSCRLDFIGFTIDTAAGKIYATATRAAELAASVAEALASAGMVPARLLAKVAGQIASLAPAYGNAACLYSRGLYDAIATRRSWRSSVHLTEAAKADLHFWRDRQAQCDGQPLWPSTRVDTIFYPDAGEAGWGGWQRRPDGGTDDAHGYFTPSEAAASSTYREALGLEGNLKSLPNLAGRRIRAVVDNQALEWGWYGGSRVPEINAVLCRIYDWLRQTGSQLSVFWLPRELNQRADNLSKVPDTDDWQLNPIIFSDLDKRWGPHTFDRFASHRNTLCPKFSSRYWCPGTQGVDAFTFDWSSENNWISPPFALMPKVIEHLRLCQAAATIICPYWPKRPWWHLICPDGRTFAPYIIDYRELPSLPNTFLPGRGKANTEGIGFARWRVYALRVDFSSKPGSGPPAQRRRLA